MGGRQGIAALSPQKSNWLDNEAILERNVNSLWMKYLLAISKDYMSNIDLWMPLVSEQFQSNSQDSKFKLPSVLTNATLTMVKISFLYINT